MISPMLTITTKLDVAAVLHQMLGQMMWHIKREGLTMVDVGLHDGKELLLARGHGVKYVYPFTVAPKNLLSRKSCPTNYYEQKIV